MQKDSVHLDKPVETSTDTRVEVLEPASDEWLAKQLRAEESIIAAYKALRLTKPEEAA